MGEIKTVAVTGSTGFVGRHMVRALLDKGYRVRALVRDLAKARESLPSTARAGLELITGDCLDGNSPAKLVAGCDACIHLVGIIRETAGTTFRRAHVDTTKAMTAACAAAGTRRYLHMSALKVSDTGKARYQTTKFEAEQLVRRSGLDWTIFRPGAIHGPGSEMMGMMADLVSGHQPPYFFIPYFTRWQIDTRVPLGSATAVAPVIAPVSVHDVVEAFVRSLSLPQTVGEIYNLVGSEELPWPEFLRHIRDNTEAGNERIEPSGVPSEVAARVAMVSAKLGLGGLLPFDEGMAWMGGQDATASLDKARAHLGMEFAGFRESFREYAAAV